MGTQGVVDVKYQTVDPSFSSVHFPVGVSRANESDYISSNGSVIFMANESTQTFTLSISEDDIPELDESFFVKLVSASLVSGGQERQCKYC